MPIGKCGFVADAALRFQVSMTSRGMFVPAGAIRDGGEDLAVTHHIWVGSKATWDQIGDSGRRHREALER